MKVGIIRCRQTEEYCPGTADFVFAAAGKGAFAEVGPSQIIGFVSCGGCPGKSVLARVNLLIERGAEVVAFASCMRKGTPLGFPCPHFDAIKRSVEQGLEKPAKLLDHTH
ncbi:MAG TPA: CGGC domain-containing protein [Candidatus Ozemobacteraceae bacterium]